MSESRTWRLVMIENSFHVYNSQLKIDTLQRSSNHTTTALLARVPRPHLHRSMSKDPTNASTCQDPTGIARATENELKEFDGDDFHLDHYLVEHSNLEQTGKRERLLQQSFPQDPSRSVQGCRQQQHPDRVNRFHFGKSTGVMAAA